MIFKNKRIQLLLLLIIAIIVILLPTVIRLLHFKQIILPGDTIYYDIRIAEDIENNNLLADDDLVSTQTKYIFNPLHYILAAILIIIPVKITIVLLMVFFSIITVILLYKIMDNLAIGDNYKIITLIIYILSPIFISSIQFISKYTLGIILFLLLIYLIVIKKDSFSIIIDIVVISLAIILFYISVSYLLFAILSLFFYTLSYQKNIRKTIILTAIIISAILFLQQIPIIDQFTKLSVTTTYVNIFQETIADLGASVGFGIFTIVLFILGLYVIWEKQQQPKKKILFIFIIVIIIYYFPEGKYLFNIFTSIIAASAFIYFIEQQWKLSLIKEISLFILILGVIFSGLSAVTRIAIAEPTLNEYEAVLFLQNQYNNLSNTLNLSNKGYVLSYYKYGHFLQSILENNGNKKEIAVFLDTRSYESNDYFDQFTIANDIFYSRDIKKTTQLLSQYKIKYIFITPAMKSGIIWKKENQGLVFLLKNSEQFKNIYNINELEIWEFTSTNKGEQT